MTLRQNIHMRDGMAASLDQTNRAAYSGGQLAAAQQERYTAAVRRSTSESRGLLQLLGRVGDAARRLSGAFGLADELALANARLQQTNDGLRSAAALRDMVYQAARRSRTGYLQTADTVAKLGAGRAFRDNAETVAVAEQLNKQLVIAGAAGTPRGEQAAAHLTQAFQTGALRNAGFEAVLETAPNLIQAVSEYSGKPVDALRALAAQGGITAATLKNALLAAADEAGARLSALPLTWEQACQAMRDQALTAFTPALEQISAFVSSDRFQALLGRAAEALRGLGLIAADVVDGMIQAAGWAADNWETLGPVIWGIVGAVAAWEAAQWALNIATYAFPAFWILGIIALIIAAIAVWVQSVGGIRMAWLILKDNVLSALDYLNISMQRHTAIMQIGWDAIVLGFKAAGAAILDVASTVKVMFLSIIQSMVNRAIDTINGFIAILNQVTGGNQPLAEHVTFADSAAREALSDRNAAKAGLMGAKAAMEDNMAERLGAINQAEIDANLRHFGRMNEIGWLRYELSQQDDASHLLNYPYGLQALPFDPDAYGVLQDTADNTGRMADALEVSEEDLKYLRDIAEREAINRFTTAEIKLDMTNYNTVTGTQDLDGMVQDLGDRLYEMMVTSAEGVYS